MNVKQLIEKLQEFDPSKEVVFAYNYGDHWRTQVAGEIDLIEERDVVHSNYHSMDKVIDEDDHDHAKSRNVVVIQS